MLYKLTKMRLWVPGRLRLMPGAIFDIDPAHIQGEGAEALVGFTYDLKSCSCATPHNHAIRMEDLESLEFLEFFNNL